MLNRFKLFLQESRQEFKRINWPSRRDTVRMVFIVVVISIFVSAFLGLLDAGFIYVLDKII